MSDKPAPKLPGFIALLSKATEDMPDHVKDIVKKVVELRSFKETLQYYEIRDEGMLRDLVTAISIAVDSKMACDFAAHKMGSETFQKAIMQAVMFSLVAGAQLAKDRKI